MTPTVAPYSDDGAEIAVATPYDKEFMETFKRLVPPQDREWDPTEKVWIVNDPMQVYRADLVSLIQQHFGDCRASV